MNWRDERDKAVAARAAALARQQAAEAGRARELVAAFVRDAQRLGLPSTELRASSYDGKARYRTRLQGWYLNKSRTIAVGTDGNYYVLSVPRSFKSRLTGAHPQQQTPKLIVGEGARDGESMPLQDLLRKRLEA